MRLRPWFGLEGAGGMGSDRLTQRGDGDGAGRKQVWLRAGRNPGERVESRSGRAPEDRNRDSSRISSRIKRAIRPRGILIQVRPGIRVESRERSGCTHPLRYWTRQAGQGLGALGEKALDSPGGTGVGGVGREGVHDQVGPAVHVPRTPGGAGTSIFPGQEFLRLPSSTLFETRRVPVGNPQGREQMRSQKWPGRGDRAGDRVRIRSAPNEERGRR